MTIRFAGAAVLCALFLSACASAPRSTGPAFPDYPVPEIPPRLSVSADVREIHANAWRRLQAGDLRAAGTAYADALRRQPAFYPAETGLGLVALANRQHKPAVTRFTAVLAREGRYLPALRGLVSAEIGQDNIDGAVAALERVIAVDPSRESERTRLELLRVRQVQQLTEAGRRARGARRHGDAAEAFRRALAISPSSTTLMRELALEELATGQTTEAEARVRKALQLGPGDAETHAALGAILDARGRLVEAASSYGRAAAIDSKWRSAAEAAREKADKSGLPDELRDLGASPNVTRGHLAGIIGIRLNALLQRAPKRAPSVATDIRTHWAAVWIVTVTQAGVMDVFANHTFVPGAVIRRSDLAHVTARLLPLALSGRSAELTKMQAARPQIKDVGSTNLSYRSMALAVTAGVIALDAAGEFQPTRPASGAEVLAAIGRLQALGER